MYGLRASGCSGRLGGSWRVGIRRSGRRRTRSDGASGSWRSCWRRTGSRRSSLLRWRGRLASASECLDAAREVQPSGEQHRDDDESSKSDVQAAMTFTSDRRSRGLRHSVGGGRSRARDSPQAWRLREGRCVHHGSWRLRRRRFVEKSRSTPSARRWNESARIGSSLSGRALCGNTFQSAAESIGGLEALARILGESHNDNLIERLRNAGPENDGRLGHFLKMGDHGVRIGLHALHAGHIFRNGER